MDGSEHARREVDPTPRDRKTVVRNIGFILLWASLALVVSGCVVRRTRGGIDDAGMTLDGGLVMGDASPPADAGPRVDGGGRIDGGGQIDARVGPTCSDGTCVAGETCSTCPADCGSCCGDAIDVNQDVSTTTAGVGTDYFGQSFTAVRSGRLTRIALPILDTSGAATVSVRIYDGGVCSLGPCGSLLRMESHPFVIGLNTFVFASPVPVVAGRQYSFKLYTGSGISCEISDVDSYAGGAAYAYFGHDIVFQTWVNSCP